MGQSQQKKQEVVFRDFYHDENGKVVNIVSYKLNGVQKVPVNQKNVWNKNEFTSFKNHNPPQQAYSFNPHLNSQPPQFQNIKYQDNSKRPEFMEKPYIRYPLNMEQNMERQMPPNVTLPQNPSPNNFKQQVLKENINKQNGRQELISPIHPNNLEHNQVKEEEIQLMNIVKQLQKKIQEAQQFGKKMKDPKKFKEFRAEALDNYINKLKEMKLEEKTVDDRGISVKLLVGRISSGKSSLINSFFNKKLAVGMGQTTLEANLVYSQNGVQLYDTPGECETFNAQNFQIIKVIASSNQVYILYNSSLKTIENMVKIIYAIKPNRTILVRTQCDQINEGSFRTLEEEVKEDNKILQSWKITTLPILTTSSKILNGFQNEKVKKMMEKNLSQ